VSKEAINAYTAMRSFTLAPLGIRINCLNPGPTDTPMMPHFEEAVGKDFMANFPKPLWGRNARPEEQAWPLLFLNSPRSSFVTGVQFDADAGFKAGMFTGQIDPSAIIPESMR
jgi:NAD(P)-dependent dehydrogenase (short-subunit alcohol dehydrogenase family)